MSENILDPKIPQGPLAQKWENYKNHVRLVNPANKRKIDIIVVGTGLAGGSAAATLAVATAATAAAHSAALSALSSIQHWSAA